MGHTVLPQKGALMAPTSNSRHVEGTLRGEYTQSRVTVINAVQNGNRGPL